jgi:predicted nucleic acid-binding protein
VGEDIFCLDTSVLIKFLVFEQPQEQAQAAEQVILRALQSGRLVVPAFAWAELGSVMRRKVRQGSLEPAEAEELWTRFGQLPIDFIELPSLRARAWEIAELFELPTLYDAACLACTEVVQAPEGATREYWTGDQELLRQLGAERPAYVRQLGG